MQGFEITMSRSAGTLFFVVLLLRWNNWLGIQAIAHDAFRALVNLTDSPLWIVPLSDESFLSFLVSYILVSYFNRHGEFIILILVL